MIPLRLTLERKRAGSSLRQLRNEAQLRKLEFGLGRAIKSAKNDFIRACADACLNEGERHFHGQLITHRVAVKRLLDHHARVVIPRFGRQTQSDIAPLAKAGGPAIETKADDDSLFERLIRQWSDQRSQDAARQISGTSLADVMSAVERGIDNGDGTDAIARSIGKVSALSPWRSLTVARTETHAAALFAQAETARAAEQELGVTLLKTWLPTLDARTRDAHAAMANHPAIPLDEKFIVGGVPMDRPGDPSAPPELVIQCRCTMTMSAAPEN